MTSDEQETGVSSCEWVAHTCAFGRSAAFKDSRREELQTSKRTNSAPACVFILLCRLWILLLCLLSPAVHPCLAEWKKTIDCPADRVYRDERKYAGREEFCEQLLPGSLVVKDGPYRSWFSEGHPGEGNYKDGRQVGTWKECDRFDRCKQTVYEPVFPEEKRRPGFKPQIPVSFVNGKYVFDFASCRSTWITQTNAQNPINLNIIGDFPYRCYITYIPESVQEHGGEGSYLCRIPFAVGIRSFSSIDLKRELPQSGLPQFCRAESRNREQLQIQKESFRGELRVLGPSVATTVDVECATIGREKDGRELLTLKLNKYAADLVKEVGRQGWLTTFLCSDQIDGPKIVVDRSGNTLFTYTLSAAPIKAKKQRKCVAEAIEIQASCH